MAREYVWLQCTESGDLNYRISINPKEFNTKKMVAKFATCPRLRSTPSTKSRRASNPPFRWVAQCNWQSSGLQNRRGLQGSIPVRRYF